VQNKTCTALSDTKMVIKIKTVTNKC